MKPSLHEKLYSRQYVMAGKTRDSKGRLILVLQTRKQKKITRKFVYHFIIRVSIFNPLFWSIENWDVNTECFDDIFAAYFMYIDEALSSMETQLAGVVVVLDYKGYGFQHVRKTSPLRIKQLAQAIQVKQNLQNLKFINFCLNELFFSGRIPITCERSAHNQLSLCIQYCILYFQTILV